MVEALSEREADVTRLLILGLRNDEIGAHLFVSTNTVKTHLAHIYEKLGVRTRTEAVSRALQLGLVAGQSDRAATASGARGTSEGGGRGRAHR